MPHVDKVVLKYFPIRGKAEPIRLMLEDLSPSIEQLHLALSCLTFYTDMKYEDIQVGPEWSMTDKQEGMQSGLYPFGELPLLAIGDNIRVTQAYVYARLACRLIKTPDLNQITVTPFSDTLLEVKVRLSEYER